MSLFSGDCQELAPCAVPMHQLGHGKSYEIRTSTKTTTTSVTSTTTAALVHSSQNRKIRNTQESKNVTDDGIGNADYIGESNDSCKAHSKEGIQDEKRSKTDGEGNANNDGNGETEDCSEQVDNEEEKNSVVPCCITRVFKKCASNGSLALYVGTRTLAIQGNELEPLKGILVLDKESLQKSVSNNFKVWGQITLTFRYGREDEEVLGLKFCNEAILALKQLWPPLPREADDEDEDEQLTPLQGILLERVKSSTNSPSIYSLPFTLYAGPVGMGAFPPPPSVLLAPAKPYKGCPIGTLYDLRIYASERPEEKPPRRHTIRLALRAVQIPPQQINLDLQGSIESRPMILSRGKIILHCDINKNAVRYGESLEVNLSVQNNSRSSIRRVLISLVQQVDVCMFTSGRFKNIVAFEEENTLLVPGTSYQKQYVLTPQRGPAKQWLALEEAFSRESVLAPSTVPEGVEPLLDLGSQKVSNSSRNRNIFAIIVSYYVKAKLVLGGLSLCQTLKVPFALLPPLNQDDSDPYPGGAWTGSTAVGSTEAERGIQSTTEGAFTTTECEILSGSANLEQGDCLPAKRVTCSESAGESAMIKTIDSKSCDCACDSGNRTNEGVTPISPSHSTSSTGEAGQPATLQHHEPQIHHYLATSGENTPSPVRIPKVPNVEHLF